MQKLNKMSRFFHLLFFFSFLFCQSDSVFWNATLHTYKHTHTRNTHNTRHSHTLTSAVCSFRESKTIYLFSSVFLLAISQISSLLHHSRSLHYYCCSVPIVVLYLFMICSSTPKGISDVPVCCVQHLYLEIQIFLAIFFSSKQHFCSTNYFPSLGVHK